MVWSHVGTMLGELQTAGRSCKKFRKEGILLEGHHIEQGKRMKKEWWRWTLMD